MNSKIRFYFRFVYIRRSPRDFISWKTIEFFFAFHLSFRAFRLNIVHSIMILRWWWKKFMNIWLFSLSPLYCHLTFSFRSTFNAVIVSETLLTFLLYFCKWKKMKRRKRQKFFVNHDFYSIYSMVNNFVKLSFADFVLLFQGFLILFFVNDCFLELKAWQIANLNRN